MIETSKVGPPPLPCPLPGSALQWTARVAPATVGPLLGSALPWFAPPPSHTWPQPSAWRHLAIPNNRGGASRSQGLPLPAQAESLAHVGGQQAAGPAAAGFSLPECGVRLHTAGMGTARDGYVFRLWGIADIAG